MSRSGDSITKPRPIVGVLEATQSTPERACQSCRHYICVCYIKMLHRDGCTYRAASASPIAVECSAHSLEICSDCHPCTCADIPAEDAPILDSTEILTQIEDSKSVPANETLSGPLVEAIWGAIKGWRISTSPPYSDQCRPQETHIRIILDAILSVTNLNLPEITQQSGDSQK